MLHLATRLETKFVGDPSTGEFEGYASVFDTPDFHGDVVKPGAFADSLSRMKAEGRMLPMYANHGGALGGDTLPVGVWKDVAEDGKGLKVKGQIAAMDTDHGKRVYALAKAGALSGLSIGFNVPKGGADFGTKAGEPKRTLNKIDLREISLVDDPSNPGARVSDIKTAAMTAGDRDTATASVVAAMRMHDKSMGQHYSDASPKDKALLMDHLRDAHEALTGTRAPDGMDGWTKSAAVDSAMDEFRAASSAFCNLKA